MMSGVAFWRQKRAAAPLFAGLVAAMLLLSGPQAAARAADACRGTPAPDLMQPTQPLNLGQIKLQVRHYVCSGAYDAEIASIIAEAQAFIDKRADEVAKPAVVLDVDETSLSNVRQILANDFGFIRKGGCDFMPDGPCGWDAWLIGAHAEAIEPTLALFKAARAKNVAIFFITGRHEEGAKRKATAENLEKAGYAGWAGLVLRSPEASKGTIMEYKSGERARIEAAGYTIIATIGDQQSDLGGGSAGRTYKLPNPFYYLP